MFDLKLQLFEQELKALTPSELSNGQIETGLLQSFNGKLSTTSPKPLSEDYLTKLALKITESEYSSLHPSCLNDHMMTRLNAVPEEAMITHFSPAVIPSDMLENLVSILELDNKSLTESNSAKVIPFPQKKNKKKNLFSWYVTTAAVAVMGLFTGFLAVNQASNSSQLITSEMSSIPKYFQGALEASIPSGELLNVSTNSNIINAYDEGLVPNQNTEKFYRAVRVTSLERCLIKNKIGEKIEIQRPVERTMLAPASTD